MEHGPHHDDTPNHHHGHSSTALLIRPSLEGHEVAKEARHQLLHRLPHLGSVMVHVDPYGQAGERHHRLGPHSHDGLPMHTHE